MKSLFNKLSILAAMSFFFACEKVENKVYTDSGTAPVLTANTTAVNLQPGLESNTAIKFNWTNPDYKFSNGISSLDVSYSLEIDTLGGNFKSSNKYTKSFSKDLNVSFTVDELNSVFGNTMLLQIDPRRTYTLQARITASVGSAAVLPLTSNVITFTASPFEPPPLVAIPVADNLWMVGDATPGGWSNPLSGTFLTSQKFTKVSKTVYQITIALPGGGGYKLIQINGDWGTQYHMTTGTWDNGKFEKKDSDPQFPGPPSAGTYKITVNFQLGTYSAVKL